MALTKDERAQQKKEYEEARNREFREFPPAMVWRYAENFDREFGLVINGGSSRAEIKVEKSPGVKWKTEKAGYKGESVVEAYTAQLTISELAELIRALTIRYNHLVREINRAISGLSLSPLAEFPVPGEEVKSCET